MHPGHVIRFIRESLGDTRKETAERANISEDYLKKIETGRRKLTKHQTLAEIANALGVSIDVLFVDNEEHLIEILSDPEKSRINSIGGLTTADGPLNQLRLEDEIWPQLSNPEWWIVRGDDADESGNWDIALEHYTKAIKILPKDYRWARYSVEKVAQMHINKGEFNKAENVFQAAQNIIDEWGANSANRDLIIGLIFEKQGWIENFRGNRHAAIERFNKALDIAQKWGDKRLESSSHHFLGRSIVEGQSRILYPTILQSSRLKRQSLMPALAELRKAKEMDRKSEPNVGFGMFWEGLGMLIIGEDQEGMKLLQNSSALLEGTVAHADPLVILHQISALEARYWGAPGREYGDSSEAIAELLEILSSQNHPYAYVRALIGFLYVRFLAEQYKRSSSERKRCVDLCIVSILLHFIPGHTFFDAATELLSRFIHYMDEKEFANYLNELPLRLVQFSGDFAKLKNFTSPTLDKTNAILELVERLGQDQSILPEIDN